MRKRINKKRIQTVRFDTENKKGEKLSASLDGKGILSITKELFGIDDPEDLVVYYNKAETSENVVPFKVTPYMVLAMEMLFYDGKAGRSLKINEVARRLGIQVSEIQRWLTIPEFLKFNIAFITNKFQLAAPNAAYQVLDLMENAQEEELKASLALKVLGFAGVNGRKDNAADNKKSLSFDQLVMEKRLERGLLTE